MKKTIITKIYRNKRNNQISLTIPKGKLNKELRDKLECKELVFKKAKINIKELLK